MKGETQLMWQAAEHTHSTRIDPWNFELHKAMRCFKENCTLHNPHSHYCHVVEGYIRSQESVSRTNELLKCFHRTFACKPPNTKFNENQWYAPQPEETEPHKQEDKPSTISSMPRTDAREPPYVASPHHRAEAGYENWKWWREGTLWRKNGSRRWRAHTTTFKWQGTGMNQRHVGRMYAQVAIDTSYYLTK